MRVNLFFTPALVILTIGFIGVSFSPPGYGQNSSFLEAGKRIIIKTEGRKDYNPKIVECEASSLMLCIRDTRADPKNNPLELNDDGDLLVSFPSWGIRYIIAEDGTGRTLDGDGNELKPFIWKLK
jgi:hypothetical protein